MNAVMLAVFVAYMCIALAIGFAAARLVSVFIRKSAQRVQ